MAQREIKRNTIARQHTVRLLIALMAAVAVFFLLDMGAGFFMDRYLDRSGYYSSHEEQYVQSLQTYVRENEISSRDLEALAAWGEQNSNIFFQIYEDDQLIFQHYSSKSRSFREAANLNFLEWVGSYPLEFSDGTCRLIVFGDYYYKPFYYMMILEMIGAFIVFLVIFLTGIRRRTRYITRLRDEIEILGSGDLEYEVSIQGNDELTDLAENLDQMRQALQHHMKEEERLQEESHAIITRLSHDIRTPLTTLRLYTELLSQKKYRDEEQREQLVQRIHAGAVHMTDLTEELFRYAQVSERIYGDKTYSKADADLVEMLTETAEALRLSGYTVEESADREMTGIVMDQQILSRILNNLSSNTIKYADPEKPVRISARMNEDHPEIEFRNACRKTAREEQLQTSAGGTSQMDTGGIGLKSVESLMESIGGTIRIEDDGNEFRVLLQLPKITA